MYGRPPTFNGLILQPLERDRFEPERSGFYQGILLDCPTSDAVWGRGLANVANLAQIELLAQAGRHKEAPTDRVFWESVRDLANEQLNKVVPFEKRK